MPKTKISEFDTNPDNNTDINNINIAEGCAPSGINNAIRQLMSDLKEQQTGASGDPFTVGGAFVASGTFAANGGATLGDASGDALTINSSAVSIPNGLNFDSNTLVIDAANNNVGIGTSSPNSALGIARGSGVNAFIEIAANGATLGSTSMALGQDSSNAAYVSNRANSALLFGTNNAERMRITNDGIVGIGTNSPNTLLHVVSANTQARFEGSTQGNIVIQKTGTNGISLYSDAAGVLGFYDNTAGLERMRIDSSGNLQLTFGNQYYGMNQYTNKRMMNFAYPTSGFESFHDCTDFATAGGGSSLTQMRISQRGNFGVRGTVSGGQTLNDYAEYFEWSDGNPSNEDRIGVTVVLDNGQIRPSTQSDAPSSIIGVVSGTAGVVLGSAPFEWSGKYQRDEFGRIKTYSETWVHWSDESGNHNYKQGEVPSDVVVPDTAEIRTYEKQLLSENYDESVEYANREHRPEWACIGLVGQVHVKKGQVVGDRWIKMKDVSENVEMWFIR